MNSPFFQNAPQQIHQLSGIFSFIIGSCVGSFLNVCIWRIPNRESVISPASHCPNCNYLIKPYENIPIISWIILRGRCSHCRSSISFRYPLIEGITGILFFLIFNRILSDRLPISLLLPFFFLMASMVAIAAIDMEHCMIPNEFTYTGTILAIVWGLIFPVTHLVGSRGADLDELMKQKFLTFYFVNNFSHYFSPDFGLPNLFALFDIFLGMLFGGGILLLIAEAGRLLWGTRKVRRGAPENMTILAQGFKVDGEETIMWDHVLTRRRDALVVIGKLIDLRVTEKSPDLKPLLDESGENLKIRVSKNHISVGTTKLPLNRIEHLVIETDTWLEPQEVLGMGDVKLMVMLGAFLGPEAVIFILFLSSTTGSILGITWSLMSYWLLGRAGKNKVPYGPYIAASALIYIFFIDGLSSLVIF